MRLAPHRETPPALVLAAKLASVVVVCAVLYWAQIVLIPLALAALATFLMSPLVTRLDRVGLPRVLAVLLVAGSITGLIGGLGYVVVGQLGELAAELPEYRENVRAKIADLRALMRGGTLERVQQAIEELGEDLERDAAAESGAQGAQADAEEPVRVAIEREWSFEDTDILRPVLEAAAMGGLAMLLSIFMLIRREDLRNRIVSVTGEASLAITTRAFAEAGERISRFLLMQFVINGSMGLAVGVGLYFIGVPYAALWGLSAALLRYIPYLGPWLAALLPIAVSVITAPGWEQVVLVIALFVMLELLSNNVMEPLLYGHSVGLSAIAVIVSAIFWTWLWGPIGLLLATPITATIVVLARYIPELGIFDRLLSEQPALQPHLWLYQRLLAGDDGEAEQILMQSLKSHTLEETCDQLLLGTLLALKRDLAAGRVSEEDGEAVAEALRELADDLPSLAADTAVAAAPGAGRAEPGNAGTARLIGFPVHDALDEVALHLAAVLLRGKPCTLEILPPEMLIGERIAAIEARQPAAVCIVSLPPGDRAASRHAGKRVRARLPVGVKVVIARLGARLEGGGQLLPERDRARVVTSLAELRDALERVVREALPTMVATPPAQDAAPDETGRTIATTNAS